MTKRLLIGVLVLAVCAEDAGAQRRRPSRASRAAPDVPGLPLNVPPEARAALYERFQKQLDERDDRRGAALRDATRLRRESSGAAEPEAAAALLFHAGLRYLDAQREEPAKEVFETIIDQYGDSIWAREARVCLFDISLEVELDPARAEELLADGLAWTSGVEPAPPRGPQGIRLVDTSGLGGPTLPLQRLGPVFEEASEDGDEEAGDEAESGGEPTGPRAAAEVAADVWLRAGLLDWLAGDGDGARAKFDRAQQFDPAPRSTINVLGGAVRGQVTLERTPAEAREGDAPEAGLLIVYGNHLQAAQQMYRAQRFWDTLLTRRRGDLTPVQRSYALLRRGQARFRFLNPLEKDPDAVLRDLEQCRRAAPHAPWADQSLLTAGDVAWHLKRDAAGAAALWRTLMDEHPDSGLAPRAAYRIGTTYEVAHEYEQAYLAFEDALVRYPDSGYDELIEKHLRTVTGRLRGALPERTEATPVRQRTPRGRRSQ